MVLCPPAAHLTWRRLWTAGRATSAIISGGDGSCSRGTSGSYSWLRWAGQGLQQHQVSDGVGGGGSSGSGSSGSNSSGDVSSDCSRIAAELRFGRRSVSSAARVCVETNTTADSNTCSATWTTATALSTSMDTRVIVGADKPCLNGNGNGNGNGNSAIAAAGGPKAAAFSGTQSQSIHSSATNTRSTSTSSMENGHGSIGSGCGDGTANGTGSGNGSGNVPTRPVGFARAAPWGPGTGTDVDPGAGGAGEWEEVVIAMGGNVGDRVANFLHGLRLLRQAGVMVHRHASLYESAPAYVTQQPFFLNTAVQARTWLPAHELLGVLKSIEKYLGRDFAVQRNGPRPLDLDIVFYGTQAIDSESLHVPHPRLHERPFVLAPLMDLLSGEEGKAVSGKEGEGKSTAVRRMEEWAQHPQLRHGVRRLWEELGGEAAVGSRDLRRIMPLPALRCRRRPPLPGIPYTAEASGVEADVNEEDDSDYAGTENGEEQSTSADAAATTVAAVPGAGATSAAAAAGRGDRAAEATAAAAAPAAAAAAGQQERDEKLPGRVETSRQRRCREGLWVLGGGVGVSHVRARPLVMGVLNVTPDSFSDGGRLFGADAVSKAVAGAREMVADGVDIVDVGGQSTRPGAEGVSAEEEMARVLPVIRALAQDPVLQAAGVTISVDTFYASVAAAAVAAGAHIVNDVSAGRLDPGMLETVAQLQVPLVLMHMRGDPATMMSAKHAVYEDIVADVARELAERADAAEAAGIPSWRLMLDPGLGFAKRPEDSMVLVQGLRRLREELGRHRRALQHVPLLLGPSRKGFLGRIMAESAAARRVASDGESGKGAGTCAPAPPPVPSPAPPPAGAARDWASCAAAAACVAGGADVVRMHNVRAGRDAADVAATLWR